MVIRSEVRNFNVAPWDFASNDWIASCWGINSGQIAKLLWRLTELVLDRWAVCRSFPSPEDYTRISWCDHLDRECDIFNKGCGWACRIVDVWVYHDSDLFVSSFASSSCHSIVNCCINCISSIDDSIAFCIKIHGIAWENGSLCIWIESCASVYT